jgi:hypothetical protein
MHPSDSPPRDVVDIVITGYKKSLGSIKPLTLVSLPVVLFSAITMGWLYPDANSMSDQAAKTFSEAMQQLQLMIPMMGLSILSSLLTYYVSTFVLLQFFRDLYQGEIQEDVYTYLRPTPKAGGIFGIAFFVFLATLLSIVLIALGLILLILPGLALLCGFLALLARICLVNHIYISEPEVGFIDAFGKSWTLTQGYFWRTVGLLCLMLLAQFFLSIPLYIVSVVMGLLAVVVQMFSGAFPMALLYVPLFALTYWLSLAVTSPGAISTLQGYYLDLKARQTQRSVT